MSTTTTVKSTDTLADFALLIFERARQLQHERTGLMSNRDARNRACMEHFTKAITHIQNVLGYVRLFGGDTKDEQIKSMIEFASSNSSKEASAIIEGMLEKSRVGNIPYLDSKEEQL